MLRLGWTIRSSGSSRLLARRSLLGGCRGLPACVLSHRRLVVSRLRWAGAGSQEDGGRGDMDVLGHQSVPSARGGVAQSHGCCQCMSGLRCSFGIKNETRRGYGCKSIRFLLSRHRLPYRLDMQRITLASTVLLLSYPSRPAITRAGWGLRRKAHGTANDWCADERSGGRDAQRCTYDFPECFHASTASMGMLP